MLRADATIRFFEHAVAIKAFIRSGLTRAIDIGIIFRLRMQAKITTELLDYVGRKGQGESKHMCTGYVCM